jgi:predicted TIM-barrel fold metal-dependent hydrolase
MKPNLYLDSSGWQSYWNSNPDYLYYSLRMAVDVLSPWRVLFGRDGSILNLILPPEKWVNATMNCNSPSRITLTDNEIEIIRESGSQTI